MYDSLESKREGCLLARSTRRRPVLPSPASLAAPPRAAPTRPARNVFGFWIQQIFVRFAYDFACSCFWGDVQASFLRCVGRYAGPLFPGRTVLLAPSPARPRPAAPPCAPTRPARGMSGFWTRQLFAPVTRAKAVDACRDSAAGAAASADGALRIDAERQALRVQRHRRKASGRHQRRC